MYRPLALFTLLLLLGPGCAKNRAPVQSGPPPVSTLYVGADWDDLRDGGMPSGWREAADRYACRLAATTIQEDVMGVFGEAAAEILAEDEAAAEGENGDAELPPPLPDPGADKLRTVVNEDPAAYWSCMEERGHELPRVEPDPDAPATAPEDPDAAEEAALPPMPVPGPYGPGLIELAACWRLPPSGERCNSAYDASFPQDRESGDLWFIRYNALVGACLQEVETACTHLEEVEEQFTDFDRAQIQLRISGASHYDAREAPPGWKQWGSPAWERECEDGCAWCCLLSARWQTYSLAGDPERAGTFLNAACDLDKRYCAGN